MAPKNSRVFISIEDESKTNQLTIDGDLQLLGDLISALGGDDQPDAGEQGLMQSIDAKDEAGN